MNEIVSCMIEFNYDSFCPYCYCNDEYSTVRNVIFSFPFIRLVIDSKDFIKRIGNTHHSINSDYFGPVILSLEVAANQKRALITPPRIQSHIVRSFATP